MAIILSIGFFNASIVFGAVALNYRTDQILVQPKAGVSEGCLTAFHAALKANVMHRFSSVHGLQVVALPAGETVASLIAKYQQSGLVEFAEPDYLVHADATLPNDPKFVDGTLWALNNYGQSGGTPERGRFLVLTYDG
jgi:hypothetical protein